MIDYYAYKANTWCYDCAKEAVETVLKRQVSMNGDTQDTDEFPQPAFFAESGYDVHCCACGELLLEANIEE